MSKSKKPQGVGSRVRGWTQWKEPEARDALESWRRSGMSASAFCAREGFSVARLRYWSERLPEAAAAKLAPMSFVPIAVGDVCGARTLEIEHAGVVIRVREELDVAHVARLVAALAAVERPC